ncbi:hypothetical protein E4U43_006775 [Claviceps pusilla]|uniref:Sin3-associated polypeptide Sap18 n=1 Tax=Claviceps pusilla TaxID=123648 RepID=A0A9P7NDI7_9HYPO|nr:hypothetical protein E4U43_006775 [Claviceps pusilla]
MSSPSDKGGTDPTAPFLVQLFYRTGGFCRPDEFAAPSLPPHISVYTWPNCTLHELALELAASKATALPYPAIGTRLAFQLVCPDLRSVSAISNAPPRYAVKDLGSIVIGTQNALEGTESELIVPGGSTREVPASDKEKSLNDARFVVGDYISCAILPPLADGSVAPASAVRRESSNNAGYRDARVNMRGGVGFQYRENGFGWPPSVREGGGRGGGRRGRGGGGGGPMIDMPMGEWRRGERLPNVPPSRPRGGVGGRRDRW